ncbi:endonuclease/exonuclease/phosphatase family protein [Sandaracinus amylolyticus]|uniref:endonuclease/exonuclease/phosphatase family protein n=1 Tax=Sandaracinus amylolyticus TaxID=927083 RepID=UPI0012EECD0B|nr:endonuclease/exonuclease/phosphatase family protein [Sandaracinus amylolyticus]
MRSWRDRALKALAFVALVVFAGVYFVRWQPDSLGPAPVSIEASAPPLSDDELAVMTINAWRLSQPARVPALVDAIDREGTALGGGRPALVGIQEIQSRDAIQALSRELEDDGFFAACECSIRTDGSLRSAVAAAVSEPYVVRGHECVSLERLFPDQRRCALLARVDDPAGRSIVLVVVHLAWHPSNGAMAAWLRQELVERDALGPRTILLGDLNAWPGTEGYDRIVAPPLRDAVPGAPATHYFGWTIDHVAVGDAFETVRSLDRRASYERIRPAAAIVMPLACDAGGPPGCPVSDHLPEGVVLRWRDGDRVSATQR